MIKNTKSFAFTLIELLVVISIIAILAGIALPVFGEVQTRGAQTKALSNAKQVGTACKLFAMDYNGNFPYYLDPVERRGEGQDANRVLQTLIPDYLPDKAVFRVDKSAYCKRRASSGSDIGQTRLDPGDNEWAYVAGLSDTSNARFPLLADGFAPGGTHYVADEQQPGGVWKGKKAVVIRVDISGNVESTYRQGQAGSNTARYTVKRSEDNPRQNAFQKDPGANPPWLSGNDVKVLNPIAP
jgi:prepilin-type N-terminal cleavage/methylation domain-containing protein